MQHNVNAASKTASVWQRGRLAAAIIWPISSTAAFGQNAADNSSN
jgi:hypothetical protein